MVYGKKEAVMTRGLAILTMVCLHLFCRLGSDILYTPLIWISDNKPFVYWIGFFCEICVPLYSLCAGYAQYLLYQKDKSKLKDNIKRIGKILKNYWIILVMFSIIGLILGNELIPGSFSKFLMHVFLISNGYNGAWWYLQTYVIILLIPSFILMFPIKKINSYVGISAILLLEFVWYVVSHFYNFQFNTTSIATTIIIKAIQDFLNVIPYFLVGAFICKGELIDKLDNVIKRIIERVNSYTINIIIMVLLLIDFLITGILNKSVLSGINAIIIFFAFNLIKKSKNVERAFMFLGKHSTNILLTHMFFYSVLFQGFIWKAKYPIIILSLMLVLCIVSSYIEMIISNGVDKVFSCIRNRKIANL
ncbi:MAG: acyltransferase [Eubacterium sp.]|nr:acyltransferase [Eubacterium sp.]